MKPPMSLQYAVWALASNGHTKYGPYHQVFYQRARKYADADEMKVPILLSQPLGNECH